MKSIKTKILVSMTLTVLISLIVVGGLGSLMSYIGTQATLKATMSETAIVAADRVTYQLQSYRNVASEIGSIADLSDGRVSIAVKKDILERKIKAYGFRRFNLLDTAGNSLLDGNNYKDRAYFKEAIQGNTFVSDPLISSVTGEVTIIVAAPVWMAGAAGGTVAGVVYLVPNETFLSDIVASLKVSEGGSAYILNSDGTTIAHENLDSVRNQENTIQDAKNDNSLADLAAIETKMIHGESGFDTYTYGGVQKFSAYAPIPETNGWSISINAPITDFTASTIQGILLTIVITIVAALAAVFIAIRLAVGIGKPVKACADRLELLSKGDLDAPVPAFKRNDEIGELVSSTNVIVSALQDMIGDIDYLLAEMSRGNFDVHSRNAEIYVGNFQGLLQSVREIKYNLGDTLLQMQQSADQVAAAADQVSCGAQALAQGATEQASSVEELSATIADIATGAKANAELTAGAQDNSNKAGAQVERSNSYMGKMTAAMDEISESSEQIGKIIATIENIAFQTNILALNAAVEAARAGSAGKGFAVVADEVRNLAAKSDQAAKATKELIEGSIEAVKNGSAIVSDVTESLNQTTQLAVLAVGDMGKVAAAMETEASSIAQITEGVDQIASVVQTNSATSEESAAASEELSSQAQILKDLIARFKLPQQH